MAGTNGTAANRGGASFPPRSIDDLADNGGAAYREEKSRNPTSVSEAPPPPWPSSKLSA
ncbi:hypothetical protein HPP92_010348 [Vanilla planifolia]|uniref:Uncharacterized protein n=1 Tax=Vanilla planifolia TaxID=51239 RepID=A0A835R401_VANPL|nr:hypothetical protein HPP92_010560 [Vanilla planifolia]KAG0482264.1 hypothetical protein HPP92_010348 [Vanilla planifolia]